MTLHSSFYPHSLIFTSHTHQLHGHTPHNMHNTKLREKREEKKSLGGREKKIEEGKEFWVIILACIKILHCDFLIFFLLEPTGKGVLSCGLKPWLILGRSTTDMHLCLYWVLEITLHVELEVWNPCFVPFCSCVLGLLWLCMHCMNCVSPSFWFVISLGELQHTDETLPKFYQVLKPSFSMRTQNFSNRGKIRSGFSME